MMLSSPFWTMSKKLLNLFHQSVVILRKYFLKLCSEKYLTTCLNTQSCHKKIPSNIAICFIFIWLLSVKPLSGLTTNRKLKYLSEAHFEFSIELYHTVAKSKPGNIVISAQNVNTGLAMLFLGSTSNTSSSQELRRTLNYENMSYVDIHKSHRQVLSVLAEPYYGQHNFFSKVGLFVQKGVGVKPDYDRAVKEFYLSQIIDVDFGASGSGKVIDSVNR